MRFFFFACLSLALTSAIAARVTAGDGFPSVDRGISAGAAAIHSGLDHSALHPTHCHGPDGGWLYRSDLLPHRALYGPSSTAARYRYAPLMRYNGYGFGVPSYDYGLGPRMFPSYRYRIGDW